VEGGRGDAGLVLELLGCDPGGGGTEHGDASGVEGVGDGAGGGRLAAAGEPDDADDPVTARGDGAQHRLLLLGEGGVLAEGRLDEVSRNGGGVRVEPVLDQGERTLLDGDQFAGGVAGGPARLGRLADRLDALHAREAGGEPADTLCARPLRVRLRPGHHQVWIGERCRVLGEPVRGEQAVGDLEQLARTRLPPLDPVQERVKLGIAEAVLGGAGVPFLAQAGEVDVFLAVARVQGGDLGGPEAVG